MAECAAALGVVSSVLTIYENCIKLYDTIQTGRSHGKDLSKLELKLQVEKWRLLAWGRSFGLVPNGELSQSRSKPFDRRLNEEPVRQMIEGIFCNIQDILQDTDGLRKRYGLRICDEKTMVQQQSGSLLPFESVYRKYHEKITRRQKNTSFSGTIRWAIGDCQKFSELVNDLHGWNDDLQNVTASFQSLQAQRESLAFDVESVADEESLQAIAEVCSEDNSEIASIAQDRLRTLESASVRDGASVFSDHVNPISDAAFESIKATFQIPMTSSSATPAIGNVNSVGDKNVEVVKGKPLQEQLDLLSATFTGIKGWILASLHQIALRRGSLAQSMSLNFSEVFLEFHRHLELLNSENKLFLVDIEKLGIVRTQRLRAYLSRGFHIAHVVKSLKTRLENLPSTEDKHFFDCKSTEWTDIEGTMTDLTCQILHDMDIIKSCMDSKLKVRLIPRSSSMALNTPQQPATSSRMTKYDSMNERDPGDDETETRVESCLDCEVDTDIRQYPQYLYIPRNNSSTTADDNRVVRLSLDARNLKQYPHFALIMCPNSKLCPISLKKGSPQFLALHLLAKFVVQSSDLEAYWIAFGCLPASFSTARRVVESINATRKTQLLVIAITFEKSLLSGPPDLKAEMRRQLAGASLIDYLDDQTTIKVYALDIGRASAYKNVNRTSLVPALYSLTPLIYTKRSLMIFLKDSVPTIQSPTEMAPDRRLDDHQSSPGYNIDSVIPVNMEPPHPVKIDRWKLEQAYLDLGPKKRPPTLRRVKLKSGSNIEDKPESRKFKSGSSEL